MYFPQDNNLQKVKEKYFPQENLAEKNYFPDSKIWERVKRKKNNHFWTVIVGKY